MCLVRRRVNLVAKSKPFDYLISVVTLFCVSFQVSAHAPAGNGDMDSERMYTRVLGALGVVADAATDAHARTAASGDQHGDSLVRSAAALFDGPAHVIPLTGQISGTFIKRLLSKNPVKSVQAALGAPHTTGDALSTGADDDTKSHDVSTQPDLSTKRSETKTSRAAPLSVVSTSGSLLVDFFRGGGRPLPDTATATPTRTKRPKHASPDAGKPDRGQPRSHKKARKGHTQH